MQNRAVLSRAYAAESSKSQAPSSREAPNFKHQSPAALTSLTIQHEAPQGAAICDRRRITEEERAIGTIARRLQIAAPCGATCGRASPWSLGFGASAPEARS